ncbi:MAG: tetratricopeptide repeat protein [Phycisphaerae bacterium]
MKPAVWLMLLSTASLSGCASNPFSASAPMHVPEELYQPAFYSVGKGLSPAHSGEDVSRRNVRLSRLMAEVSLPVVPARKTVSPVDQKKALVFYGSGLNAAYQGRYSGALYLLLQSDKFNPNSAKTFSALAQVSLKLGDTAGADRYMKSALHLNPLNPKLQLQAAALDISHGRRKASLRHLLIARKSPQLKADSPLLPRIDFLLGAALQSRGYYGAAAEAYQQTASLLKQPSVTYQFNVQDHRLMRSRGLIHFLIGRNSLLAGHYRTAAACFDVARRQGFTNPVILGQLALAMEFTGHPHAAAWDAVDYCVRAHGSPPTTVILADIILDQQGPAMVLAAAKALKAGSTAEIDALACVAHAAWVTGHPRTARRTLARLCMLQPAKISTARKFIVLSVCTGRRLDAVKWITRELAAHRLPPHALSAITADFFGLHPSETDVRRLLQMVLKRRAISVSLPPQQQVEQLQWQYGLVDNLALLTGRRQFALTVTGGLLQRAPQFWPTIKGRCLALALGHRYSEADELIRRAVREHLGGADAYVVKAEVYASADRMAAAMSTAINATYTYSHDRPLWRELERLTHDRQYPPDEINILQHEVELFPQDRRVAFRLVQVEYEFGDIAAFRVEAQGFLSRFGHGKRALIAAAMVDAVNHDWPAVKGQIAAVRRLYPTSRLAAVWLALLSDSMGHSGTGIKILRRSLHVWPADPDLLQEYIDLCNHAGQAGAAFTCARRLARRFPDSQAIGEEYLDVLIHNHLWLQAHRLVTRWLAEKPTSHRALEALWRVYFHSHHYAAALAVARKLVNRPIPRFTDLSNLANTLWKLGNRSAALNVYRRILAIEPQNAYANNNLGFEMLQANQNFKKAMAHIQLAVHNYPNVAQYLDSYGWALYKLGFAARAIPYLQRAVILVGIRHPTVYRHLGDALAGIGDWHGALLVWQAAIKMLGTRNPLSARQQTLLDRLKQKVAAEKMRESLNHLKHSQAM